MNTDRQRPDASGRSVVAPACAAGGLGCLTTFVLGLLAVSVGWWFSGLDQFVQPAFGAFFCFVVVVITAVIYRRGRKTFSWTLVAGETLVCALVTVLFFAWFTPRDTFRMFLDPIPRSVVIHQGHSTMFGVWFHFSASPADVTSLIRARHLEPVTDSDEPTPGMRERDQSLKPHVVPKWWQPGRMPHPVFYYRIHDFKETSAPWVEGIWVNGETNEAYAYISG